MRHPYRPRRLPLLLLLALTLSVLSVMATAAAGESRESPYFTFAVDNCSADGVSGTSGHLLTVKRDASLPADTALTLAGWAATEKGISGYSYLWLPSGGGYAEWRELSDADCRIFARNDLTSANIPYPTGHATAGFELTLPPPENLSDGYYDIYIRATDGEGAHFDFLALPHLRYGNADADDGKSRRISFDRLSVEAATDTAVLQNGAELREDGLCLPDGGTVRLGELDLTAFEAVAFNYRMLSEETTDGSTLLGLKTSDRYPFLTEGREGYNLTDTVAYSLLSGTEGRIELDLTDVTADGTAKDTLWLVAGGSETVVVTDISFVYKGQGTDRVAAKIYLSESLISGYFSGQNAVSLSGVKDPLLGDVLRIEVAEGTNDPYVHFYAEQVLATADIRLSADTYKYMVVLARAMPHNTRSHMTFYLCAGAIIGATEACTTTFAATTDGEWHYYLIDLTAKDTWAGIIHGWRFDIINGDCHAGDAVDYASVQFFRTKEAAMEAAARSVSEATPYAVGDPLVYLDMIEEGEPGETLSPDETYTVTEAETLPATEPDTPAVTLPHVTEPETAPEPPADSILAPEPESPAEAPTESAPESQAPEEGCGSVLSLVALLLPLAVALPLCRALKKSRRTD